MPSRVLNLRASLVSLRLNTSPQPKILVDLNLRGFRPPHGDLTEHARESESKMLDNYFTVAPIWWNDTAGLT